MATEDKWEKVRDDDGQVYWWNTRTNESRWDEPPSAAGQQSSTTTASSAGMAPPPPKRGPTGTAVPASPPSSAGAKLGNLVSAGSTMVKSNSMRIRGMMKKDGKDVDSKTPPPPNGNAEQGGTWEARRKKSFQAAYQAVQAVKNNLGGVNDLTIDGHLQQQARETNRGLHEVIQNVEISRPYDVEKKIQVRFDEENIRYSGIPEGWAEEAHRQFGVPLHSVPRSEVPGYTDRIPLVLIKLKARFIELGGLQAEGVFRLAPDGQDVADAKLSINTGQALQSLAKTKDPHVVANLIKQFFRELKPKVLNPLPKEQIVTVSAMTDLDEIGDQLMDLPDPQRSSYLWLLDLLSEVAAHHEVNRMTPTNLAIVLSPNLFDAGPDMDPFEELVLSQKVAAFTLNCLKWRIKFRTQQGF